MKTITAYCPHKGDYHLKVMESLYELYEYEEIYWRSIVPPNNFEFVFKNVDEQDIAYIKRVFREIYADFPEYYKNRLIFTEKNNE